MLLRCNNGCDEPSTKLTRFDSLTLRGVIGQQQAPAVADRRPFVEQMRGLRLLSRSAALGILIIARTTSPARCLCTGWVEEGGSDASIDSSSPLSSRASALSGFVLQPLGDRLVLPGFLARIVDPILALGVCRRARPTGCRAPSGHMSVIATSFLIVGDDQRSNCSIRRRSTAAYAVRT